MSKGIPLSMIWDVLDKKYKFLAKDDDDEVGKEWYAYTHRPVKDSGGRYWNSGRDGDSLEITLPIDAMHDVPWDQTLIERPLPIQELAFGKFWNGEEEPEDMDANWDYLRSIDDTDVVNPYESKLDWWKHFIPKIPTHLCTNKE